MPTKEEKLLERLSDIGEAAIKADLAWKNWLTQRNQKFPPGRFLDAVAALIQKAILQEEPLEETAPKKLLKTILLLSGIETTDLEKGFKINVEIKFPPEDR